MSKDNSREERLAAQLRENLKRRKAQKKALSAPENARGNGATQDLPKGGGGS
ncbi:hypothetical protein [Aurantiacibacter poecillastricola]|uniref:hypothetical protein n=1 Tax=Aurantiacibacter poecillastricola TaxID=3064385 RepID=UPI00273E1CAA|nr:hypothetical protein [Aurantiacibacter sp. 219JJ12-13]MDP5260423.1 hypothetical protein [Aurantiacibacter sp. 219JJ12-13]